MMMMLVLAVSVTPAEVAMGVMTAQQSNAHDNNNDNHKRNSNKLCCDIYSLYFINLYLK